jgi:hypothetical protein
MACGQRRREEEKLFNYNVDEGALYPVKAIHLWLRKLASGEAEEKRRHLL